MKAPEPQPEHKWLHRLVGEWTFESEASMGPDAPPAKCVGTEIIRSLGGLWVVGDSHGEHGGQVHTNVITLGYDTAKKKFVGSFVASVMTQMWLYEGTLQGDVLTLNTTGPSFTDPTKSAEYHDVVEIKNDNERVLWSESKQPDGTWLRFMTMTYRRTK